jgi:hypothetical protein
MYMCVKVQETPYRVGIYRKGDYISLTPPSNSWWNNTEFGEEKAMLRFSLGLHEEVYQL